VTGGSGVIGEGVLLALLKNGHEVRLLTREAARAAEEWPGGVESFQGDVTDPGSLRGAADGCDAVLHITGIVEECEPDQTFEHVNVGGTRNMLAEAERGGVRRFVYVSSLGAERGESAYHLSKRAAEALVRASKVPHLVVRPGNVYGPGDQVISTYLTLFRTLPAVPIVGDGDQTFQPIFYRDLGQALARALELPDVEGKVYDVAGEDLTSMNDLADRFERITGRAPLRVPVPEFFASAGVAFAEGFGASLPLNDAKLKMLLEGNALRSVFGVAPTPLDAGLRELADAIPEQLPTEGFGSMEHKRFWADVEQSGMSAPEMLEMFRRRCNDVMPIDMKAEPHAPEEIEYGATLTLNIPARGNVQVRAIESNERRVTLATIAGHPLAGVVRFLSEPHGDAVRFAVETYTRPATRLDYLAIHTIGRFFQDANWQQAVERTVKLSGGAAPRGVEHEAKTLDAREAAEVERWVGELVATLRRETKEAKIRG
jgi:NADH dehydrogenase